LFLPLSADAHASGKRRKGKMKGIKREFLTLSPDWHLQAYVFIFSLFPFFPLVGLFLFL